MAHFFIFTISALLIIVSYSLSLIRQVTKIKKVRHDFLHTVILNPKMIPSHLNGIFGNFACWEERF